ncbi:MAG TPA: PEP/pyruvate-binding domain-containing protein [Candidatus Saccharimonadales bacterium]|nr:PEP/pyruvate-binding domain-containing protein [Candidatus Saccharimonadales bacterium]
MSVRRLPTVRSSHAHLVGGKAASLGEMLAAGHPVPPAFVITADELVLSPALSMDILKEYEVLGAQRVAVRSSGVGEDGHGQSWAGQFETKLHVGRDEVLSAIQSCWDSAQSARAGAYANERLKLAVLVQRMVESESSGVAFSVNPITGNTDEIIIESLFGLGELLVQGAATPDNFLVGKHTGDIIDEDIAHKPIMLAYHDNAVREVQVPPELQYTPSLSHDQVQAVAALARTVEAYYGYPIDIEWAFEAGTLYLLQARPITTL